MPTDREPHLTDAPEEEPRVFGGVRYFSKERQIEFDGHVLIKESGGKPMELIACTPGGKTHESVFAADIKPSDLHVALREAGMRPWSYTGRQAADTDAGQVGTGIAAMLGLPLVTAAQKIEAAANGLRVERVTSDGYEVVESVLPAVVTASSEVGDLRMPNVKSMMAANKVQPPVWSLADLGIDAAALKKVSVTKMWQPVVEVNTEVITGETPEEAGANLAARLKEDGII